MFILGRETSDSEPVFKTDEDRGYTAEAWYLKNIEESSGDAAIIVKRNGDIVRMFLFPGYKVWNIAAHFQDIVDSEIGLSLNGYAEAASTGLESLACQQHPK